MRQTLRKITTIVNLLGWVCVPCRDLVRNQLSQLNVGHNILNGIVEQLKDDASQLKQDIASMKLDSISASRDPVVWPAVSSKKYKKQLLAVVHNDLDNKKHIDSAILLYLVWCRTVKSAMLTCSLIYVKTTLQSRHS